MDLYKFRIAHSMVMEHYQFIEMHLEGIYAALSGKGLYDGLKDVEKYSISKIIRLIQEQESRLAKRVISDSEYKDLKAVCLNRNFWVHNCYTDMVFDRKTGAPKKEADIKRLNYDIKAAEQIREFLYERKKELLKISREE